MSTQRRTHWHALAPNEIRRRIWHFVPGCFALGVAPFFHRGSITAVWFALTGAICVILPLLALRVQNSLRRADEPNCFSSIGGYTIGVMSLFCVLPNDPELGLSVAGILAFGDGSATLFGLLYGHAKLPWNQRKTWVGTAAFILFGLPAATFIYWLAATPRVQPQVALACVG